MALITIVPFWKDGFFRRLLAFNKDEVKIAFVAEIDFEVTDINFSFLDHNDFLITSKRAAGLWGRLSSEIKDGKQIARGELTLKSSQWNQCTRVGIACYVEKK
ncbi:MAG: hypothetical protein JJU12_02900 [Chlamydiales bacterium]|nr:hypothetical protein [Chlamydiales bacterium]